MDDVIEKFKAHFQLNDDQIEIIKTVDGPLLVIAGPGTGKTQTIVLRTLYLLMTGKAKPEEIILTTFTEKAAFELRDRISQLARKFNYIGDLHLLKMGTIHNLCNSFIMKFLSHTKLKKGYSILDELTQVFFLYENYQDIIADKHELFLKKWKTKWNIIKRLIPYLNKITEELIDIDLLKRSKNILLRKIAECYEAYQNKLFETNRVDFAHLQKIFFDLLNENEIYQKIKQNIKYLMIDEYQDTNYIQEQILLKLAQPENNICVVGDEDQALYRFRGATVRNLLEFPKNFSNCKKVNLVTNYRSHKVIIEKYNKFITSIYWANFRNQKEIKPDPSQNFNDYPAVFKIWTVNKKDEAERFVNLIQLLKENRVIEDWSDIALILKSVRNEFSGHYIKALKKANIPYFCPRSKMYFENEEVKIIIACYAIIFGFYKEELEDFPYKQYIENSFKLLHKNSNEPLKLYLNRKVRQLKNLIEGSLDLTVLDYFYQLLAYSPFSTYLKEKNKAYNLSIFSKLIATFQDYYNISLITASNKDKIKYYLFKSFLFFLLTDGMDEYEDPDNPVPKGLLQIMTIHQSKGLEFPVVFVGTLDKNFVVQKQVDRDLLPYSKRGTFETEDQMTLFDRLRHYYVAFSRSKNLLVLTTCKKPQRWFSPIWDGLDQFPYIDVDSLNRQRFKSKPAFVPKKSYSFTQVNVYETCPQQYLFYKEYEFQPSRSAQVLFGSLVHHTIEDVHRAIIENRNFDLNDIEDWLEQNYKALLLSGLRPISKTQKETALKQVINYYNQNKDLLNRISETEIDVSLEKDDYIIKGKIDLLLGQNGEFEILDFKTQQRPDTDAPIIEKYFKQLCLYAYILREKYGKPIKKMYIYWTSEEKRNNALMEFNYTDQDFDMVANFFDYLVQKIKNEEYQVINKPDTNKVCKECDFRFYCSQNGIIKFETKELEEI